MERNAQTKSYKYNSRADKKTADLIRKPYRRVILQWRV